MTRGGARKGAGRPKGKEPTKAVRLPLSVVAALEKYHDLDFKVPLYLNKIAAGFPSPAEDYIADRLNLNEYLVKHPAATFLVRATGDSMLNAGIHDNDILIVDRSMTPVSGKIVIAAIDGQLTVKRLLKENDKLFLMPDNPDFKPIEVKEGNEVVIWGVVIHVIHSV
jgi:DNA polymerase V